MAILLLSFRQLAVLAPNRFLVIVSRAFSRPSPCHLGDINFTLIWFICSAYLSASQKGRWGDEKFISDSKQSENKYYETRRNLGCVKLHFRMVSGWFILSWLEVNALYVRLIFTSHSTHPTIWILFRFDAFSGRKRSQPLWTQHVHPVVCAGVVSLLDLRHLIALHICEPLLCRSSE